MSDGLLVLAVDDEQPVLADVVRLLRSIDEVADVDAAGSGEEALRALSLRPYDALFLDVRMPGLDGLELAGVLRRFTSPPSVVFVTAYETAAVDAFELNAADYLLKPVSRLRLGESVERVLAARAAAAAATRSTSAAGDEDPLQGDVIPVDNLRGGVRLVSRESIIYLQAHGDYVRIVADAGRFLMRVPLSELEARWERHGFARAHRGYLANLRRAVEVRPKLNGTAVLVMADGSEVPVARRQIAGLRRRLSV
jgi:two-component system response regulator LytT